MNAVEKRSTREQCKNKMGLENKKKQKVNKTKTRRQRDIIRLEPPPVEGGSLDRPHAAQEEKA